MVRLAFGGWGQGAEQKVRVNAKGSFLRSRHG